MFGNIVFEDEKHGLTGYLNIGDEKGVPKDYFTGCIEKHGQTVCNNVYGNYMGYADFDGERYLDIRDQNIYKLKDLPVESKEPFCLESEARKRPDLVELDLENEE